jgi:hypothetical protein
MKVYKGEKDMPKDEHLPRSLWELDQLGKRDPERDEVSKRLTPEDQVRLMKRYGYDWTK